jgi:hypothetical protein
MKKIIIFILLLGVTSNVLAIPTLTEVSATGTTFKFATKLSEILPKGYKVKIDLNNGKGLVAMTCSGLTCLLYSNALPKLDLPTYKIGIYDAKGVLQGKTTNGSYVIVSKAEINTIPISTTGYTKISNLGAVLPDTATLGSGANDWACTKDNKTGLTWEVKTSDGGLRDKNNEYTNYDAIYPKCGWNNCEKDYPSKFGSSTNTDGFVKTVNAKGLCGKNDWRMPTKDELEGLLTTNGNLYIDANYFPNTNSAGYWSSSPDAYYSSYAWGVNFGNGYSYSSAKDGDVFVRLVR